ncbi:PREDICTED: uncharacterized protein LOC106805534 [Priapulus caudatus]|uniref:Uncharacterized protein LOC106805534 n=1 Tax=Priapulus caudatus TaxID=37621 RepID=A0ABM1DRT2_PRICU|nr:PREDICTED: uncharacterized protein LOC106805534 [Priapulus caudatus]
MAGRQDNSMNMFVLIATGLVFASCFFILIAYCSPNWVEKDKRTANEFIKIGLWEVCFNGYRHPQYQYDKVFTGCRWIFHRDMYIIREYLEPSWFKAVQVFCTFSFLTVLLATGMTVATILQCCDARRLDRFYFLQGVTLAISCLCMVIGVIIFAVRGDDRNWMQYPHFNHLSWSFAMAIIGAATELGAAALYILLAIREYQQGPKTNEPLRFPPYGVRQSSSTPTSQGKPYPPSYQPTYQPTQQPQYQPTQQSQPYALNKAKSTSKEDTV